MLFSAFSVVDGVDTSIAAKRTKMDTIQEAFIEASYASMIDSTTATDNNKTSQRRSSSDLQKQEILEAPKEKAAIAPTAAMRTSNCNRNAPTDSSKSPTMADLPLHSPSMTSSPRSAELASSEVSCFQFSERELWRYALDNYIMVNCVSSVSLLTHYIHVCVSGNDRKKVWPN